MKVKFIKKHEILQRQGDSASKFYRVRKGLLRSFIIDEKGKEHIFMFAPENWIAVDSTGHNSPADLFIDALEDSEVEVYDKRILFESNFGDKDLPFDIGSFARRIAAMQKRILMLMSASAIERYEHFLATYPDLSKLVSQKMIASYIGITPEALSKVKGIKAREGRSS